MQTFSGATDSNTRKLVSLADIQALQAENPRKLTADLQEEYKSQTSEEKSDINTSEGSKPNSANSKTPRKFMIKYKRPPSQETKGNSKRNSIDSTRAASNTTGNAQGSLTMTEKSRKSSNVSEDDPSRPQDLKEEEEELKHQVNGIGTKPPQHGKPMGADYFYSIEENKSEKSGSDSFQSTSKFLKIKSGQSEEKKENSVHKTDKMSLNESTGSMEFTSITMGTAEIRFGEKIGEGKIIIDLIKINNNVLDLGAYGIVYKAINFETGNFIAVKHIKMADVNLESSIHLKELSNAKYLYGSC